MIELAIFCIKVVLPAFGGATIKRRWPFPIGLNKSTIREETSVEIVSRRSFSLGYKGVRFSKGIRV